MSYTVYAWLVVNGFIYSEKFQQIFDWLVQAARRQGCELEIYTNTQLLPEIVMGGDLSVHFQSGSALHRPQFVIFWDKDVRLARLLEKAGLQLFNSAKSIEICDDKARTFLELSKSGIRMPRTVIAPMTFRAEGYIHYDFLDKVEQQLGYPMIIKECYGSFGQQVYLVQNREEALSCMRGIRNRPFLFQEFVASSKGHDIRIQMVGEQAAAAMHRVNTNDFRANITNGGSMEPHVPSAEQLEMARRVMRQLQLDFAGVDILSGRDGEPVLCEVNSNAHFVNIWKCTGVNAADAIVKYCMEHCGSHIDQP